MEESLKNRKQIALIVGEDSYELESIISNLSCLGIACECVQDPSEGLDRLYAQPYSLVVTVDKTKNSWALVFCQMLRRYDQKIPLLLVIEESQPEKRILALELGADECLNLHLGRLEFRARIRALLRRCQASGKAGETEYVSSHTVGELEVDLEKKEARLKGTLLKLTPTEFTLLRILASNPGKTLSQGELACTLWGPDSGVYKKNIRWHISRLRKKLDSDLLLSSHIITVRGMGYRLDGPTATA